MIKVFNRVFISLSILGKDMDWSSSGNLDKTQGICAIWPLVDQMYTLKILYVSFYHVHFSTISVLIFKLRYLQYLPSRVMKIIK